MTRTEFVKSYARRSGLDDRFAGIGLIAVGGHHLVALPCACGEESCEGWAMVTASAALHHLAFYAPEPLRTAYCDLVRPDNIA